MPLQDTFMFNGSSDSTLGGEWRRIVRNILVGSLVEGLFIVGLILSQLDFTPKSEKAGPTSIERINCKGWSG